MDRWSKGCIPTKGLIKRSNSTRDDDLRLSHRAEINRKYEQPRQGGKEKEGGKKGGVAERCEYGWIGAKTIMAGVCVGILHSACMCCRYVYGDYFFFFAHTHLLCF